MKHKKVFIDGRFMPQRTCTACRSVNLKCDMIRVVKTDSGIDIDKAQNKNGRGVYICKKSECIEKARKVRGLERGLKSAVPKEIYEGLEDI